MNAPSIRSFCVLPFALVMSFAFAQEANGPTGTTEVNPNSGPMGVAKATPATAPSELLLRPQRGLDQPKPPAVPMFDRPSSELKFSIDPNDGELISAHCFGVPLAPLPGNPQENENRDLAKLLIVYVKGRSGPAPLVEFLNQHPDSRWRPSLLLNIGLIYEDQGRWSKTIPAWEESWKLTKTYSAYRLKAIADRSLGEMVFMHGRLGHYGRLQDLFAETNKRDVRGPGGELYREAKAGLWLMQNKPEEAFRCGPLALSKFYEGLNPGKPVPLELINFKSTQNGTSLAEIKRFANKIGLPCQVAFRAKGAAVLVPCIVNWNVEHYAAITRGAQGGYLAQDLTFGRDCLISPETLDSEASGYFLVRDGPLPAGWRSVSTSEAALVYGRGSSGGATGPGPGSCRSVHAGGSSSDCQKGSGSQGGGRGPSGGGFCGMTTYSFDVATISLILEDKPVGYSPPVGRPVFFTATYNQRDITDRSNVGNLGDNWSFQWFSYIQAPSTSTTTCYGPGNGSVTYTGYNSSTGYFAPELMSQDTLQLVATNSYVLTHRDGSKEIYNLADSSTPARVFRTASVDALGNQISFGYDSYFRMETITDAIGQTTVISYGLSTDPTNPNFYLITKVTDPFGRFASFAYNNDGQLVSITDVLGLTSSYTYGPGDFITALATPYGTTAFTGSDLSASDFEYERWLMATDPLGASEKIEWNNNATNFQDVNSSGSATVSPSGFHNVFVNYRTTFFWSKKAMETDPNDLNSAELFHFVHNPSDTSLMGYIIESHKMPLENRVWSAYPGQPDTIYAGTTDQPSKVARILDDGSEQDYLYQYNAADNVTQTTDPLGRQTSISYATNLIDVTSVRQKNGSSTDLLVSYTYNSQHEPLTYTDPSGETTTYTYNTYGELLTVTDALSETTAYNYNSNGYLTSIVGPVSGATTSFTYDGFGRVSTTTTSDGYELTYGYDNADRLTSVSYPDGTYSQVIFDKLDPEWTRDRLGRWSLELFDSLRRLILQRDALLRETLFQRCICGALTGIIDPSGNQTSWTLDLQNRVTKKTYADSSSVTYAFENTTSRLKSITDALSQVKTYSYYKDNSINELVYTSVINATPNVSFTYDTNYPRITTMVDGTGTTTYSYNAITSTPTNGAGRVASVAGPITSSTVSYSYDALGRVSTRSVNGSSNQTNYGFDSLGRISGITNPLGSFTPTYVNQTARISSMSIPNGQVTNYSYYPNSSGSSSGNGDDRLETISNLNPSSNNISTFGYSYDSDGQILNWSTQVDSNASQSASFQYDAAEQLVWALMPTTVGSPAQAFSYEYDFTGNRTQEQIDNSITTSTFDNLNQLTSQAAGGTMQFSGTMSEPGMITVSGNAGSVDDSGNWIASAAVTVGANSLPTVATDLNGNVTTNTIDVTATGGPSRTLTYDANGNLTNNGAGQTYAWDAENRLISVTQTSGTTGFVYNGLGQRVQESLNGTLIKQWVWAEGPQPVEERNSTGSVTKRFFGSLGEQIGAANYYFTTDHLGSVHEITDSTGTIQARYSYDPFGRRTLVSGTDIADFGFTGDYYHSATGLSLTKFREYDPNLGRWLNADPIGIAGGLNLYGYVGNNPISAVDPFGLWPTAIHNQIAQNAFGAILTPGQLAIIEDRSAAQDNPFTGGQSREYAYQHAMRAPWQSVDEAKGLYNQFLTEHLAAAIAAQRAWKASGHCDDSPEALDQYGYIFHAVTDSISPAHRGFQIWNWPDLSGDAQHVGEENVIYPNEMRESVSVATGYYNLIFNRK